MRARPRAHRPASVATGLAGAGRGPMTVVEAVYAMLGGEKLLGTVVSSDADLVRVVRNRIPLAVLSRIGNLGFSEPEIDRLIIPARTRRHRASKREPLTVEESDRAVRLMRVQALSEQAFANTDKANRWLRQPLAALDGLTPLDAARTETGARVVERILAGIAWGAAA